MVGKYLVGKYLKVAGMEGKKYLKVAVLEGKEVLEGGCVGG